MPSYLIYIVEDHPVMQQAYADLLCRASDFSLCGTSGSAEEALGALGETVCDLVVADISLPGIDGIEFVRQLGVLRPGLPTVVISGHDEPATIRRATAAGANGFLSKVNLATSLTPTLRHVIEEALRSESDSPAHAH